MVVTNPRCRPSDLAGRVTAATSRLPGIGLLLIPAYLWAGIQAPRGPSSRGVARIKRMCGKQLVYVCGCSKLRVVFMIVCAHASMGVALDVQPVVIRGVALGVACGGNTNQCGCICALVFECRLPLRYTTVCVCNSNVFCVVMCGRASVVPVVFHWCA